MNTNKDLSWGCEIFILRMNAECAIKTTSSAFIISMNTNLVFNNIASDRGSTIALRLLPLEIRVVFIPIMDVNVAWFARLI